MALNCSYAHYNNVSVDIAVARVLLMGVVTKLVIFDMESAYRVVPVHPDDRPLLGMAWRGQLYVDMVLPFSSRCNAGVNAAGGDRCATLLGQFLVISLPKAIVSEVLSKALDIYRDLGVPIAVEKT